uniref:G10 protein n=1 Tax=Rhizochromulina marina TaxID=1034831 RepID=A0A7S2RFN8_9STRA|eukprot:CAMPEP_0118977912 /NCGR_PEP_ID=MMETSP1173-20130426/22428_1 /TAXON_ID=1034831 /ORGANISM="Rhizochromulina marina cf, Strain CCMP1243" /LENGTH=242 /DNA_ID=CAMNT_0006928063 /DNA_START=36 /DNA_END=764 /DNA_ORIENTATION=+
MSRFGRKGKPPAGFDYIEPILSSLENELRDQVNESHEGKRKTEALWPVHQINWQRSRYVFDMYYKYKKISKEVYDYCIRMKLVDAALIAKWKKSGYERLCSTYVINTKNYKFGTTSICRVPGHALAPDVIVEDRTTGCQGCASGPGGQRNIFGNKYGQYLAAIQIAREEEAEKRRKQKSGEAEGAAEAAAAEEEDEGPEDGPQPDSIWARNDQEAQLETVDGTPAGGGASSGDVRDTKRQRT